MATYQLSILVALVILTHLQSKLILPIVCIAPIPGGTPGQGLASPECRQCEDHPFTQRSKKKRYATAVCLQEM